MGHRLKLQNNKIISCSLYDNYESFPIQQKLIKAQLEDGTFKYFLIDKDKSPFDSGLRYLSGKNLYQVDSSYLYNIFDVKFSYNNFYVNLLDVPYATALLNNIFDTRVTSSENDIYLVAPKKEFGITKILMIGLNISISYIDSIDDEVDDCFKFSTTLNGWCNYFHPTIERHKMKAMLVKLDPHRKYKINFSDSFNHFRYNEGIKNCLFFGKDIEKLDETSKSYHNLWHITNFFTMDNHYEYSYAGDLNSYAYKDLLIMKDQYARYSNNRYIYNYYDLNDIKIFK